MAGDWIKLHRKTLDSLVNSDAGLMHLWVNLLLRANWKPSWFLKQRIGIGQIAFSCGNFADDLKISRRTLIRRLQELENGGMITVKANNRFTVATICKWKDYQDCCVTTDTTKVTTNDTSNDTTTAHQTHIKRTSADTHPKKERRVRREEDISSQDLELANWMKDLLERMQPGRKPPPIERWADEFRKLREIDQRTPEQIKSLFSWVNQDSFWRTNILSPQKLREKWDDLELRRTNGRQGKAATGEGTRPTGSIFA